MINLLLYESKKMDHLPIELKLIIMAELSLVDLIKFSLSSKYYLELSLDRNLWIHRLKKDFKVKKSTSKSWNNPTSLYFRCYINHLPNTINKLLSLNDLTTIKDIFDTVPGCKNELSYVLKKTIRIYHPEYITLMLDLGANVELVLTEAIGEDHRTVNLLLDYILINHIKLSDDVTLICLELSTYFIKNEVIMWRILDQFNVSKTVFINFLNYLATSGRSKLIHKLNDRGLINAQVHDANALISYAFMNNDKALLKSVFSISDEGS